MTDQDINDVEAKAKVAVAAGWNLLPREVTPAAVLALIASLREARELLDGVKTIVGRIDPDALNAAVDDLARLRTENAALVAELAGVREVLQ